MLTTSEIIATATIWVLTSAGVFFGTRAAMRKRKKKSDVINEHADEPRPGVGR